MGERSIRISMTDYVQKLLKKFDMLDAKTLETPSFEEKQLYDENSKPCDFDYRGCVGALQWLVTCCRPDIAHSTGMLSHACARPVAKAMQNCCHKVLSYLKGTADWGIEYSPDIEREFNEEFKSLAAHADNADHVDMKQLDAPVHTFTDASFGVAYKTMRSVSGVAVYLHGMPVAWKSRVQTVFTSSTTASEWVAMSDGLEIGESVQALMEFLMGSSPCAVGPLWCDNRGAVLSSRKGFAGESDEIPKRTRHVALRHARVIPQGYRVWFCSTTKMKADGLTKSVNKQALQTLMMGR